jgi:hypothetical protein
MFESVLLEKRLRNIGRRLTQFDLQRPDLESKDLTTADIEQYLMGKSRSGSMFLNYYTRQGLSDALERYGTFERLQKRGFDPYLSFSRRHPQSRIKVTDGKKGPTLIELVARFVSLKPRSTLNGINTGDTIELIAIEWLMMQNPKGFFDDKKRRLPGQQYPGLRIGREIMALLTIMTERLEREGLLAFPEHYHNGLLYDREFRYFSPEREGELRALQRDLKDLSLSEASWAVEEGLVIDSITRKPYKWRGEEMIWPFSKRLQDYFNSVEYTIKTDSVTAGKRYLFDPKKLEKLMNRVKSEGV